MWLILVNENKLGWMDWFSSIPSVSAICYKFFSRNFMLSNWCIPKENNLDQKVGFGWGIKDQHIESQLFTILFFFPNFHRHNCKTNVILSLAQGLPPAIMEALSASYAFVKLSKINLPVSARFFPRSHYINRTYIHVLVAVRELVDWEPPLP